MQDDAGLAPPSPLEIVASRALDDPPRRLRPPPRRGASPRAALESAVHHALSLGQLSVSFSGGRDSSLVLAVACHVARREGFPDPVAVTLRHDSLEADERDWQELVIGHLGIQDWVRLDVAETMDALGDQAVALLRRRGLLLPPNAYLHLPMVEAAPPGVLLTGAGGDEILGTQGERLAQVRTGRVRPRPRDVLTLGLALAPARMRAQWRCRRMRNEDLPWILPCARAQIARRRALTSAATSWRWDVEAVDFVTSRSTLMGRRALRLVGDQHDTPVRTPLMDLEFVRAFAGAVGPAGPIDRTTSMRMLAADLLPDAILRRSTKAAFGGVVWGPRFREFVSRAELRLPAELARLVDSDALRAEWGSPEPHYGTLSLVQAAWLTAFGSEGGSMAGPQSSTGL